MGGTRDRAESRRDNISKITTGRSREDRFAPESSPRIHHGQDSGDHCGGVETEAGAIIAKAKVKIDTKISNSWTWFGTQTVTDTNTTAKGYRAVLGQMGWKLTGVKEWAAAPCKPMKKTIITKTPREGDMSIGRLNK